MQELSLHVLDIAENSAWANATLICIGLNLQTKEKTLLLEIKDNGTGMSEDELEKAANPFFTSRTTRDVGLGLSFLKQLAEQTDGSFGLSSTQGLGTTVTASFTLGHLDLPPLGDMPATVISLIQSNPETDFLYTITADEESFTLDTRELREMLQGVSLSQPQVAVFLREYMQENSNHIQNRSILL